MNPTAITKLPCYQCHKQVWAAKIVSVSWKAPSLGATLRFDEVGVAPIDVPASYLTKHDPKVGGYYVVYADGYELWSPAEVFESGYTRCVEVPSQG